MAWRLDWLGQKLFNKSRKLTKQTAASAITKSNYSNAKIKNDLNYKFKPISESIKDNSILFLKDFNNFDFS